MACPRCGGSQRTPVAPGYWRCTSDISEVVGGPGLADVRLGPPVVYLSRSCGHEYQEGAANLLSSARCSCSLFAIGLCVECSAPFCGDHRWKIEERWHCRDCWLRAEAAVEAQRAAAAQMEQRSYEVARAEWVELVTGQVSSLPRAVRIVSVVRLAMRGPIGEYASEYHLRDREHEVDLAIVAAFLPELVPTGFRWNAAPWRDEEIAEWFAGACKTAPTQLELHEERRTLLGYKKQHISGWAFYGCSTCKGDWDGVVYGSCGVAADGRRLYGAARRNSQKGLFLDRQQRDDRFDPMALARMARMAELPRLPNPPSRGLAG